MISSQYRHWKKILLIKCKTLTSPQSSKGEMSQLTMKITKMCLSIWIRHIKFETWIQIRRWKEQKQMEKQVLKNNQGNKRMFSVTPVLTIPVLIIPILIALVNLITNPRYYRSNNSLEDHSRKTRNILIPFKPPRRSQS